MILTDDEKEKVSKTKNHLRYLRRRWQEKKNLDIEINHLISIKAVNLDTSQSGGSTMNETEQDAYMRKMKLLEDKRKKIENEVNEFIESIVELDFKERKILETYIYSSSYDIMIYNLEKKHDITERKYKYNIASICLEISGLIKQKKKRQT